MQIFKPLLILALAMWQVPMVQAQCSSVVPSQPVTVDNESTNLPNSRQLVNGTNTTIDTTTAGQIKVVVPGASNGCRLSLSSSAPVPSSDIAAATTLYLLPYKSKFITFDTSSGLVTDSVGTGISISLSGLTAGSVYDVFGYDNSGTPTLTLLAWTNTTTRATALAYDSNGGFLVKSGTTTQRYLGSIYITATGQSEDEAGDRALFNYDNRVLRSLVGNIPVASWNYSTNVVRAADNNTTNGQGRVSFLTGVVEDVVSGRYATQVNSANSNVPQIGIGLNNSGTSVAGAMVATTSTTTQWQISAEGFVLPPLGYNYLQAVEFTNSVTCTFHGNGSPQFGLLGMVAD